MSVNCLGYSTMTVTSTAKVLATACSPVMPSGAKGAYITAETDDARWRADGTAPTATEGHLIDISIDPTLTFNSWSVPKLNWRQVLNAIQFIRVTADAALKISWYD